MSYLFRVAHSEHLFAFSAEEKIERPTKHHPQLGSKARKLREIDGSPKPPGGETGKVYSKYSGHTGTWRAFKSMLCTSASTNLTWRRIRRSGVTISTR